MTLDLFIFMQVDKFRSLWCPRPLSMYFLLDSVKHDRKERATFNNPLRWNKKPISIASE